LEDRAMGAKTWMLVYSDYDVPSILAKYPEIDRQKTEQLVKTAFPKHRIAALEDTTLCMTCPSSEELVAGCFEGVTILAAEEFGIDYPSKLDSRFVGLTRSKMTYLFAMHSGVDFFAYAIWDSGMLKRSLSVSPDSGVMEDIGERLLFEVPFWEGKHPAVDIDDDEDEYPLNFHPLEFGEATLSNLVGYSMEGPWPTDVVYPEKLPLMTFSRKKSLFKLF
jgi:hypothetical protein